jgi:uncharacterized Zn-binding protein involved in type VI secretion
LSQPFIVLGDRTSHGGTVVSADLTCDINGKYLARVGDKVVCPKCKGTFAIVSGASDMLSMGHAPAVNGDKTACGATLISSQVRTTWESGSASAGPGADAVTDAKAEAARLAAPTTSGFCVDCLVSAAAAGSSMVLR